jgi:hypothetical protein
VRAHLFYTLGAKFVLSSEPDECLHWLEVGLVENDFPTSAGDKSARATTIARAEAAK